MLELTSEQVAGLAEIDARGYVERVRQDLVKADPKLADDNALSARLWSAYVAARQLGIRADENVEAFLRIEAYAPSFYTKPATHAWLTRPGRSPDERFHDYLRVIKWRVEHPTTRATIKVASRDGRTATRGMERRMVVRRCLFRRVSASRLHAPRS